MPTKSEQALEMLRAVKSFDKIREQCGSAATYKALEQYFEEVPDKVTHYQDDLQELEKRKRELTQDLSNIDKKVKDQNLEYQNKQTHVEQLNKELKSLADTHNEASESLERIERQIEKYGARGIKDDTYVFLDSVDFLDNEDLLKRIRTIDEYRKLCSELDEKNKSSNKLAGEIQKRESQLTGLKFKIDEISLEHESKRNAYKLFEEDLLLVQKLREKNYGTGDLEALTNAIAVYRRGSPSETMKTLLEAIAKHRDLADLETLHRKKRQELETTEEELDEVKSTITALKENNIKEIIELTSSSKNNIESLTSGTISEINKLTEEAKYMLQKQEDNSISVLGKMGEEAKNMLKEQTLILNEKSTQLQADIEKWGQIQQEIGKYTQLMKEGHLLLGILTDPSAIKTISPTTLSSFMSRINTWLKYNYGKASITPSQNVCDLEGGFSKYSSYNLIALSTWLEEELKNRVMV